MCRKDYHYNTAKQRVIRFSADGTVFAEVPNYQLTAGIMVMCAGDVISPVTGRLVALQPDEKDRLTPQLIIQTVATNHKVHTGENMWHEAKTQVTPFDEIKTLNLDGIRTGRQTAILAGAEIKLFGRRNIATQIAFSESKQTNADYQKKSVIDQLIQAQKLAMSIMPEQLHL